LTPWPYKTGLKGVEESEKALNVVYSMYKGIVSQQCCSKLLKMKKTVYSLIKAALKTDNKWKVSKE
jgi:hypothetical protein